MPLVKMHTSGGIGNNASYTAPDKIFRIANSGRKIALIEAAIRKAHKIVIRLSRNENVDWQPLNITKIKREWLYAFDKETEAEFERFLTKGREFFIPSLVVTLISAWLQNARMKFERGPLITIGCKPWYGGWYELAVRLGYNNPDLFWADGDITGLDKHITDWMLYLYMGRGSRYYNWTSFNRAQRRLLRRLYALLMYHVVNKITLQPGTIWRLIRGVMYSGGKETSHGDSWITALIFFLYIEYVCLVYPESRHFIEKALFLYFICIIVFGDDHIWCCPKWLRHLINVNGFAKFLKDFLGMELRDFREYDTFLSEVDFEKGTIKVPGPKFLKRYFIQATHSFMAPVVPFKPYFESTLRMVTVEEGDDIPGLILKTIGMAWDTYGTNIVMYELTRMTYDWAISRYEKDPIAIVAQWRQDPEKAKILRSMERKVGIKDAEFFDAFPALEKLQQRHIYDRTRNHNKIELGPLF